MWTKERIAHLLNTNDLAVERAIVALYDRQVKLTAPVEIDGQPWSLEGAVFEADEPIDDLDEQVQAIVDEHESETGCALDAYGELEWELPDFQLDVELPEFEAVAKAFIERVEQFLERLGMIRVSGK